MAQQQIAASTFDYNLRVRPANGVPPSPPPVKVCRTESVCACASVAMTINKVAIATAARIIHKSILTVHFRDCSECVIVISPLLDN